MTTEIIPTKTNGSLAEPQQTNLVGGYDAATTIKRSREIADELGELILRRSLFTDIRGKKYVHLDGWQVAGTMLGVVAIVTDTEQIENGWKARAEARTLDGRVIGAADSICTRDEKRGPWKNAEDYAIIAMAQTRAMSRALRGPLGFILKLSGYESTTAEDADAIPAEPDQEPQTTEERIDPDIAANLYAAYKKSPHKADALKMQMAALGASDTSSAQAAIGSLPPVAYEDAAAWIGAQS